MAFLSEIANYLLYTPFDVKAVVSPIVRDRMNPLEFIRKCYVHPEFEKMTTYIEGEDVQEDGEVHTMLKEIGDKIQQQAREYHNFCAWMQDINSSKVYTINGNAGVGKTTFLNYLKYTDVDNRWIILDVSLMGNYIIWAGDVTTYLSECHSAHEKVYATILHEIRKLFFNGEERKTKEDGEEGIEKAYQHMKRVCINYSQLLDKAYPGGSTFFRELVREIEQENDRNMAVIAAASLFKRYFKKIDEDMTMEEKVYEALNILLIIVRCIYKEDRRYMIAFDNLERFISNDEIYNKEVDQLRRNLVSYISMLNTLDNCHCGKFKFVMCIRSNTARMCGVSSHSADEMASNLDLDTWFSIDKIIEQKKQWYQECQIEGPDAEKLEQIIGDIRVCQDGAVTGLKLLIDQLFNDNKRLITDFIGIILEETSNKKNLRKYDGLWREDTCISRFAARSIFRGMLFYELEEKDKLFRHLKACNDKKSLGIGDTRKVLTLLYNHLYRDKRTEVPLLELLRELFGVIRLERVWEEQNGLATRRTIAEILYYMNSYNRRENDWIQFIDLQISNTDCDVAVESIDDMERLIVNDVEKVTVSIMPAGIVYLTDIVPSFEFFSVRYCSQYNPLFALVPDADEIRNCVNIGKLPCIQMIDKVEGKVEECIGEIFREGDIRLYIKGKGAGILHADRIINHHVAYLDKLKRYIEEKYIDKDNIPQKIQNKYQIFNDYIIGYRNKYMEIRQRMGSEIDIQR